MEDSASRIYGSVMLIFAMLIAVGLLAIGSEIAIQQYITNQTSEFVDACRVTGKISPTSYEKFATSIQKLGYYQINIQHEKEICYPAEDGEYIYDTYNVTTDTILQKMYSGSETVPYIMNSGDAITVTVIQRGKTLSGKILSLFVNVSDSAIITVYGGGVH